MGGGGFSMTDGESAIDDYLLSLTGSTKPRVCFIPTASGDDPGYMARFQAFLRGRAETHVLSLFGRSDDSIDNLTNDPRVVLDMDAVYVGGGSTANLLAVWRVHDLPELLEKAAGDGTVLAGISAGMNCWFESSLTDSFGPLATLSDGLGFLPGSACPHYDGEVDRRPTYLDQVSRGLMADGYAVQDYCALHWEDGELVQADQRAARRPRLPRDAATAKVEELLHEDLAARRPSSGQGDPVSSTA